MWHFGEEAYQMGEVRHIVYCGDEKYVPIIGISMTSVVWNNPGEQLCFHLVLDDIQRGNRARLERFYALYRNVAGIRVHIVPKDSPEMAVFRALKTSYPVAVSYRLLLPRILGEEIQEALYLDGDVVCQQSLASLFQAPLPEGAFVAGAVDADREKQRARLHLREYVNTGVLRMDLAAWRRGHILERAMAYYQREGTIRFPDQDAINCVCAGHIALLPNEYNYPADCHWNIERWQQKLPVVPFLHFWGELKPWHVLCLDPRRKYWLRWRTASLWWDMPLWGEALSGVQEWMPKIRQLLDTAGPEAVRQPYYDLLQFVWASQQGRG